MSRVFDRELWLGGARTWITCSALLSFLQSHTDTRMNHEQTALPNCPFVLSAISKSQPPMHLHPHPHRERQRQRQRVHTISQLLRIPSFPFPFPFALPTYLIFPLSPLPLPLPFPFSPLAVTWILPEANWERKCIISIYLVSRVASSFLFAEEVLLFPLPTSLFLSATL